MRRVVPKPAPLSKNERKRLRRLEARHRKHYVARSSMNGPSRLPRLTNLHDLNATKTPHRS